MQQENVGGDALKCGVGVCLSRLERDELKGEWQNVIIYSSPIQERQRNRSGGVVPLLNIPWSSFLLLVVWPFVCVFVTRLIRRLLLKH